MDGTKSGGGEANDFQNSGVSSAAATGGAASRDDVVTEEGSSTESDAERLIKEAAQTLGARQTNQCYCGGERILGKFEMQCVGCYRWFHEACLDITIPSTLPFTINYAFICKTCNPTCVENFQKKQPDDASHEYRVPLLAIENSSAFNGACLKSLNMLRDKEIIPWIDRNWENLTSVPRRIKQTWHSTILKTMQREVAVFLNQDDVYFGLVDSDLFRLMPPYDSQSKLQLLRTQDQQIAQAAAAQQQQSQSSGTGGTTGGPAKRGPKRKLPDGQGPQSTYGRSKVKSDLVMPRLPPGGYPLEHPFNKDGFHYFLAEPDPHAPFRQEFDDSVDWAGKPIPGWLYRKLEPEKVLLAMHDRAPQLKISEDRLSITGEKGYSMARATHGVCSGAWYFEAIIQEMPDNSATRIGWAMASANLQVVLIFLIYPNYKDLTSTCT
ncbi:set1/Ash2 histone methyltransferase complex subunit ASH2-like [Tropilaelaps mercedesae]|uniref:Set1/Ash2 histone methyltransferase complex subunit ASH2-like n=1 Tax=Tropilaelaps mercedesae TaxID=418985 RepID=A0A1V9XMR3_9ACAR|nr:set1/Ash2 histone methyltransferase complex subunit ASH2-like [Tropilaelaps mercedesae]